jgi:hypothetical protein
MQNVFHQFEKSQKFHGLWLTCVEITDDNGMLLVYWIVRGWHEQQNQEFRPNREN